MSEFKIYLREPKTITKRNWFKSTSTTFNEQVKHVIHGEKYSILQHDSGLRRLIIKEENGSHVFSCRWDDLHAVYIDGRVEVIDE